MMANKFHKKIMSVLFIAVCIVLHSTVAFSANTTNGMPIQLAVGSYSIVDVDQPMLFKKDNLNNTWLSLSTITDTKYGASLNTVTCTNETCISAGSIFKGYRPSAFSLPVLLTSTEVGNTWRAVNIANLPAIVEGGISQITCNDKICNAIGFYRESKYTLPLLLISYDSGRSWSFNANITNLPSSWEGGSLNSIACEEGVCIATGTSSTTQEWFPLILVSHDHGKSWSYIQDINGLPNKRGNNLTVNKIQCHGESCVIAGDYKRKHAFLLQSQNKGQSWTYVKEPPELLRSYMLSMNDLVYTNGTYIAVGEYRTQKTAMHALMLMSKDNGQTWSLIDAIAGTRARYLGELNSISCTDNVCITGGSNSRSPNNPEEETFLISRDSGQTWSKLTRMLDRISTIHHIQCIGNQCLAVGNYSAGGYSHPLILTSKDKGETWSMDDFLNFPNYVYTLKFKAGRVA